MTSSKGKTTIGAHINPMHMQKILDNIAPLIGTRITSDNNKVLEAMIWDIIQKEVEIISDFDRDSGETVNTLECFDKKYLTELIVSTVLENA